MRTVDPDRACPHENFLATVEVARQTATEDGPVIAYSADVRVRCADCDEPFRWVGVEAGTKPDRPMCSVDETELRAPIRPASADPDFGMGLPGFAVRFREGVTENFTEPDLEAIEARLAGITPTHWVAGIDIEPEDGGYWTPEDIIAVDELPVPDYSRASGTLEDAERISAWADDHLRGNVAQTHSYSSIPDEQHDANQRLIAHAPDDLRALVAEVRRLRADQRADGT